MRAQKQNSKKEGRQKVRNVLSLKGNQAKMNQPLLMMEDAKQTNTTHGSTEVDAHNPAIYLHGLYEQANATNNVTLVKENSSPMRFDEGRGSPKLVPNQGSVMTNIQVQQVTHSDTKAQRADQTAGRVEQSVGTEPGGGK